MTAREKLHRYLNAMAESGAILPSNDKIAVATGLPAGTVRAYMTLLSKAGSIMLESHHGCRQVVICATGKRTAFPDDPAAVSTVTEQPPVPPSSPIFVPVESTPADELYARAISDEAVRLNTSVGALTSHLIRLGWHCHVDDIAEETRNG